MADDFYMQYAAHVDRGITHSSTKGQITLGVGGLVIGVAIVLVTLPESVTLAVVLEGASTAGLALGDGKIAGGLIDGFIGGSVTEWLVSGLDTVRLGPAVKQAARVHPDTVSSGDHANPAEGSKTVLLGPEFRPMSRRGDRMTCGGTITEGLDSVVVGGLPSQQGVPIEEQDPALLKGLSVLGDVLTLEKSFGWKLALGVVSVGAEVTGHDRLAKIAGAPTSMPTNLAEGVKSVSDGKDAIGALLPGSSEGEAK